MESSISENAIICIDYEYQIIHVLQSCALDDVPNASQAMVFPMIGQIAQVHKHGEEIFCSCRIPCDGWRSRVLGFRTCGTQTQVVLGFSGDRDASPCRLPGSNEETIGTFLARLLYHWTDTQCWFALWFTYENKQNNASSPLSHLASRLPLVSVSFLHAFNTLEVVYITLKHAPINKTWCICFVF
jgi:hypothetical protein